MSNEQSSQFVYARAGDNYIVGVDLESIVKRAAMLWSTSKSDIQLVKKSEIPEAYRWGIRRAEDFPDWVNNRDSYGTFVVPKHFESWSAFRVYYPSLGSYSGSEKKRMQNRTQN